MKKTLFNKFIALICVAIASILFVGTFGCGANDDNSVINTGKYIVNRAKTDYRIIIAKEADEKERLAARELQTFFYEATNCRLNIVDDENVTFDENAKYYSVGRNNFQKTSGVDADAKELKAQGYRIKTKGNSVFLIGGDSYGTLYSVYGYLGLEFDYDYFFTDVYCINKNVNDLELKNYDVTKSPDIDVMAGPNVGFVIYNTVNANRFGSMATTEWNIPAENYYGVHNVFAITPKDRFDDETNHPETYHPEWFADNGTQVCFTAHGDKDGYSALKARYLEVIKNGIKKTDSQTFIISQADNGGFCTCDECNKEAKKYGANSAVVIKLANYLSDEIYKWFNTEEGKPFERDFKICILAYQDIKSAPVKSDGNKTNYVPTYPEMACNDNVGVYLAFDVLENVYSADESETNRSLISVVHQWRALTDNFWFWIYDVNFNNYFYPVDTSSYKQDFYRLMAEVGARMVNDQSQTQNVEGATAWNILKNYISSKLRWDVNANQDELVKKFFKNCYSLASDTMYNVYLQYKAHAAFIKDRIIKGEIAFSGNYGNIFCNLAVKQLWSKSMLTGWYEEMKKAIDEISPLKASDKPKYEKTYKMICAEIASPVSILLELYREDFSPSDLKALQAEFKRYCMDGGISYYYDSSSYGTISEWYKKLQIYD